MRISGIILCGGQGRRMQGQDKGWVEISGKPMIERVIDRFKPQVDELLINANRNIDRYRRFNLPIVKDTFPGYQGPLAGILSGMAVCENDFIVCVPCDCPFFPTDLVARMLQVQKLSDAEIVSVSDAVRIHPVFALISTKLKASLEHYLESGQRKIDCWYEQHNYQLVDYTDAQHCFDNINTPAQLEQSSKRIQAAGLPTLGFAAFSGTGKTSLLKKLIPVLKQKNIRVAVIKHAHHDFEIDLPGKDSYELRHAGADQVIISSAKRFVKILEIKQELTLQDCLARVSACNYDLVLVEGYKMAKISKIEVHRPALGFPLLYRSDKHIIAVASDRELFQCGDVPVLDLNRTEEIANFIISKLDELTLSA